MFLTKAIVFSYILTFGFVLSAGNTCSKTNCQLPCCQCPIENDNPTKFNTTDIPQLILFTFIGNLNEHTLDSIREILNPIHRNPNHCPLSSTFFVNDNYTDYCLVQRLFDNHNEIAMTTSSNKCPLSNCYDENQWRHWIDNDWEREIKQQRLNIIEQSRIHQSHIKGFRVPHLQIDENKHLELIQSYHFHYDSSMLFKSSNLIWPFTLDHSFNITDCINCYETDQTMEALWQFPLHEWSYPNTSATCRTLFDLTCLPDDKLHTADLLYDFIKYNFDLHSSLTIAHRSPFVIELDLFWLSEPKSKHLEALVRFIEFITTSKDHQYVYFVSIEQALEWLKHPRALNELDNFWAFGCSDTVYEYDIDCSDGKVKSSAKQKTEDSTQNNTNKTGTTLLERRAEELFRSNIVVYSIWVFLFLIFAVLFYDKYFSNKS